MLVSPSVEPVVCEVELEASVVVSVELSSWLDPSALVESSEGSVLVELSAGSS